MASSPVGWNPCWWISAKAASISSLRVDSEALPAAVSVFFMGLSIPIGMNSDMNTRSIVRGITALALTASLLALEAPAASPQATSSQDPFPVAAPESVGIPAAALEALAADVHGYVARDLIVGGELLVIKDSRTVLHRSFGLRDREKGLAWSNGTVCNIRSMTKTLTGAAAQLLIDRDELSLDDKVADYLPGFDTKKSGEITIEQLL